jgi:DNA-binding CsgD family transcriptional regulator
MPKRIVFDPNAKDGDGDFKVQDGTPFERPNKPSIPKVVPNLSANRSKRWGKSKPSLASSYKRTVPLRPTNVSPGEVSTGGLFKMSEIFKQDLLRGLTPAEQQSFLGVDRRTFAKMKKNDASLTSFAADNLALNAFGYHPIEIWGEVWMTEQILYPKKSQIPPTPITDIEESYLKLRAEGKSGPEIAKKLGVTRQRVAQLKASSLKKRDQQSLLEDDELEKRDRISAAADAAFLDTGVSPTGLIGRMAGDPPDDHPMWETPQDREDREQAFADFIFEKYIQPWEADFWERNGRNATEDDLYELLNSVDEEEIRESFEAETGISSWGLEYDEVGDVRVADWAEAGFMTQEEYDLWYDNPIVQDNFVSDKNWRDSAAYKTYGGTEDLMNRNIEQHGKFNSWAQNEEWYKFHNDHFDWWAFPIEEPSNTYGEQFRVPGDEVKKLRSDKEFLKRLDDNLINVAAAYGWDIKAGRWIPDDIRHRDQVPQTLSQIRLYKMARSALVFGRCSHFRSLQRMYDNLASFGWYKGQDLGFWAKDHPCSQS